MPKNAKALVQKYILLYPDRIITCSLRDLANQLHYSQAAVIKSLRLLGYNGLKDLKQKLFLKMKLQESKNKQREGLLIQSLMATDRSIGDNVDINLLAKIIKGQKIVLQGFGTFYYVAQDFQKIFTQIGFDAFSCNFKEQLKSFEGQTLFLLTGRGTSPLTTEIVDYASKKNMKIVAITSSEHSLEVNKLNVVIPFIHFSLGEGSEIDKNILIRYVLRTIVELIKESNIF